MSNLYVVDVNGNGEGREEKKRSSFICLRMPVAVSTVRLRPSCGMMMDREHWSCGNEP